MNAEILPSPPISGRYRERHFAVSARGNTWVRFANDRGDEWVGVFGSAELAAFETVVPFPDDSGRTVLVISGGQGYVVDAESGELLRQTPWDCAYCAAAAPGHDFVLVANTTSIWASTRTDDRFAWRREQAWYDSDHVGSAQRVAVDGIVFDGVTIDALTGTVWEMDGWYAFRLQLPSLEFIRGALIRPAAQVKR